MDQKYIFVFKLEHHKNSDRYEHYKGYVLSTSEALFDGTGEENAEKTEG